MSLYESDTSNTLMRLDDVYRSIQDQGSIGLPVFMIEDHKCLQELINWGLVEPRPIGKYKELVVFLTHDTTRLQALANLMFPLSTNDLQSENKFL